MSELQSIAQNLVAGAKGILAADESENTIKKRFDTISLESNAENRRLWRELLFTTAGIEQYISGVILFDETIRQRTHAGIPFPEVLSQKGIIPGIKVDRGTVDFPNFPGDKVTEGLDGLVSRLTEYKSLGAKFAKWRAVFSISETTPSAISIEENARILARYAAACQSVGIVPIVEPEVLMDGVHPIEKCREVSYTVWKEVFASLSKYKVDFSAMLLKPNMVIPGHEFSPKAMPEVIAEHTVKVLAEVVPDEVPGVVFLSGGQIPVEATVNLNAISTYSQMKWRTTFSYGRALQEPVLVAWSGKEENKTNAQNVFLKRAKLNSFASIGQYKPEMENV